MSDENEKGGTSADDNNVIHVNFGGGAPPAPAPEAPFDPTGGQKLEVFSRMVDGGTVMATLDARVDGVIVPDVFAEDLQLNLNFCHQFMIPDFDYDRDGVRASLSFSGRDHWCDIPWAAIYMLRSHESGEVLVFPTSLPEEIKAMLPQAEEMLAAASEEDDDE